MHGHIIFQLGSSQFLDSTTLTMLLLKLVVFGGDISVAIT